MAQSPGKAYNPLFVYGGVGLGKTHLRQAIGHEAARSRRNLRVSYVTCEQFTNEFIQAVQTNSITIRIGRTTSALSGRVPPTA